MSILVNNKTKLVVQGITGREGSFHAIRCKNYGTNLVAGVTPSKAPGANSSSEAGSAFKVLVGITPSFPVVVYPKNGTKGGILPLSL